jgi:hypothetical protein
MELDPTLNNNLHVYIWKKLTERIEAELWVVWLFPELPNNPIKGSKNKPQAMHQMK